MNNLTLTSDTFMGNIIPAVGNPSPFIYNDVPKQQPEPSITDFYKEPSKEEVIEKLQHQIRDMYKNNDRLQSDLNTALSMVRMLMNRNYYY